MKVLAGSFPIRVLKRERDTIFGGLCSLFRGALWIRAAVTGSPVSCLNNSTS